MSRWATALLFVTVGAVAPAAAQDAPLAPLPPTPPPAPYASYRDPPPVLGAPIAVKGEPVNEPPPGLADAVLPPSPTVIPASAQLPEPKPSRAATLGAPTSGGAVPAGAVEVPARTAPAGPVNDPVNDLLTRRSSYNRDGQPPDGEHASGKFDGKFDEKLDGILGQREEWFKSDAAFCNMISPVTNPFLFEDPRSLTEIRPIFIYQRIPGGQPDFFGGNVSFFGTQARVAITNRLSFTVNKLGGIWLNPNDSSPIGGDGGFAEIWLGPKFTFIRNEQTGSLLAGGLQFQIPAGSSGAFQHTGTLSIVPYATYGQNFLRDWFSHGFNGLIGAGYSFSTNHERSDYFYLSGHLDLPVRITDRVSIYPLAELNYWLYTTDATSFPIGSEGRDLINFGGQAKGNNLLTGAIGARVKFTEAAQLGAAFEIPFAGNKDLFQYRFTVDLIFRY
jgi:hypothetical protein